MAQNPSMFLPQKMDAIDSARWIRWLYEEVVFYFFLNRSKSVTYPCVLIGPYQANDVRLWPTFFRYLIPCTLQTRFTCVPSVNHNANITYSTPARKLNLPLSPMHQVSAKELTGSNKGMASSTNGQCSRRQKIEDYASGHTSSHGYRASCRDRHSSPPRSRLNNGLVTQSQYFAL